jgi:hypothetical protein
LAVLLAPATATSTLLPLFFLPSQKTQSQAHKKHVVANGVLHRLQRSAGGGSSNPPPAEDDDERTAGDLVDDFIET